MILVTLSLLLRLPPSCLFFFSSRLWWPAEGALRSSLPLAEMGNERWERVLKQTDVMMIWCLHLLQFYCCASCHGVYPSFSCSSCFSFSSCCGTTFRGSRASRNCCRLRTRIRCCRLQNRDIRRNDLIYTTTTHTSAQRLISSKCLKCKCCFQTKNELMYEYLHTFQLHLLSHHGQSLSHHLRLLSGWGDVSRVFPALLWWGERGVRRFRAHGRGGGDGLQETHGCDGRLRRSRQLGWRQEWSVILWRAFLLFVVSSGAVIYTKDTSTIQHKIHKNIYVFHRRSSVRGFRDNSSACQTTHLCTNNRHVSFSSWEFHCLCRSLETPVENTLEFLCSVISHSFTRWWFTFSRFLEDFLTSASIISSSLSRSL